MCTQKEMGRDKVGPCKSKSVVYLSTCTLCREEGRKTNYTGETGRGVEERLGEHLRDGTSREEKSHMHQHLASDHPEKGTPGDPKDLLKVFEVKTLYSLPRPLHRQIMEALTIGNQLKAGAKVLNQKNEYNRCLLPELLVQNTTPTANIQSPTTTEGQDGDTLGRYSLEETRKRDNRTAGTRPRVIRRKRARIEKAQDQNREKEQSPREHTPDRTRKEQKQTEENLEEVKKKRKATEHRENPRVSPQDSTQEKLSSTEDPPTLLDKLRGRHTQPASKSSHNPSTHKPTNNLKGKPKLNNPYLGTVKRGRRRSTRDNKASNNVDIRSYFKSVGDKLRDRETDQHQEHSERDPDHQEIPRDPGRTSHDNSSDHHLTVEN